MSLKKLNVEKVAKAIEADAGESLEGLRESLAQAKAGVFAEIHTPQQIAARQRGRPAGSVKTTTKEPVKKNGPAPKSTWAASPGLKDRRTVRSVRGSSCSMSRMRR